MRPKTQRLFDSLDADEKRAKKLPNVPKNELTRLWRWEINRCIQMRKQMCELALNHDAMQRRNEFLEQKFVALAGLHGKRTMQSFDRLLRNRKDEV